jgi:hypothetical protein
LLKGSNKETAKQNCWGSWRAEEPLSMTSCVNNIWEIQLISDPCKEADSSVYSGGSFLWAFLILSKTKHWELELFLSFPKNLSDLSLFPPTWIVVIFLLSRELIISLFNHF